jgi:hypothetical protein
MEDHQIKQLKRFKTDVEKNVFKNEEYEVYIRCNEDLTLVKKQLTVGLEELV